MVMMMMIFVSKVVQDQTEENVILACKMRVHPV